MTKPIGSPLWHPEQLRVKGYLASQTQPQTLTTLRKRKSNLSEGKRHMYSSMLMWLYSQNGSLTITDTYILVRHFPVRSLSIGHDLPHDNAIAPCITRWGEFSVGNSFWGCPPYGNFPTLENKLEISQLAHKRIKKWSGSPTK